MASDAAQQESKGDRGVSGKLPKIVAIEALRVSYLSPTYHVIERELRAVQEAVEIVIQTAEPIPERSLAPVLFVGEEQLTESEPAGPLRYRFFGLRPERLQEGAPIALGWTMSNSPRVESPLRFRIHGEARRSAPERALE